MHELVASLGRSLVMAAAMFWQVGWSLVFGLTISAIIQAFVSKQAMRDRLGQEGLREIALATAYGAASSSCSYASAAVTKTLIAKGAGLIPSLAFLFSSTNLVVELGIILYLLMGWQFVVAEWVGGVILVAIMSLFVRLTYPRALLADARKRAEEASGYHLHGESLAQGRSFWDALRNPHTQLSVARNFVSDWSMLWKDILGGFLIAGALAVFVQDQAWKTLFVQGAPAFVQVPANAIIGPLIAILSFVCSIGNVPLAAILWSTGISFGGVLSFLYADLIVLPLLDAYRRYFGLKMAAYIGVVFFATMATAGILMDLAFAALHLVPLPNTHIVEQVETFAVDYTFWLNLLFGALAAWLAYLNWKHPMVMDHEKAHAT